MNIEDTTKQVRASLTQQVLLYETALHDACRSMIRSSLPDEAWDEETHTELVEDAVNAYLARARNELERRQSDE